MNKFLSISLFILFAVFFTIPISPAQAQTLSDRLKGCILLQVEKSGEAWYVYPVDQKRYYLGRPSDAFNVMRSLGLGISEKDYQKFLNNGNKASATLRGRILLRVQANGEAYYVNASSGSMTYLGRPEDAFAVMRNNGLGITNSNLAKISIGQSSGTSNLNNNTTTNPQEPPQEYDLETGAPIPLCTLANKCERYKNVSIYWDCNDSHLPASWKATGNFRVTCGPVESQYIANARATAKRAIDKYPTSLFNGKYLRRINLVGELRFDGKASVGTVDIPNKVIYISIGMYDGVTEKTIHHEFSSILFWKFFDKFNEDGWKALNKAGFKYGDTRQITDVEGLLQNGFTEQYGMDSVEQDVNTTVEPLFLRDYNFIETGDYYANLESGKYPILNAKFNYLVNFYHQIDPMFTVDYFKEISRK